ncbi:MAG TPA: hypothetical protein VGN52_03650 [Burkholderiales bacterium]|jgi:hypothetical protein
MNDLAQPPSLASIVFMRLPGFDGKPVREQATLGEQLHALIGSVLSDLPPELRLVLEAPGGAALVFPDDPALALTIAERLQAHAGGLDLCIGINHGPVKLWQMDDSTALIGDGLQAAAVTASFATPERWLAARAFRDALAQAAPGEAERLAAAGTFTDDQVRSHELYALDLAALKARQRRLYLSGGIAVAAILAAGVGARALRPPPPRETDTAAAPVRLPAQLTLDVHPGGDVYLDGQFVGQLPEQRQLYLAPGRHKIEVRFGQQPPLLTEVNLGARERLTLTHQFSAQAPAPAPAQAAAEGRAPRRVAREREREQDRETTTAAPAPAQGEAARRQENGQDPGFWRRFMRSFKQEQREAERRPAQQAPVTP